MRSRDTSLSRRERLPGSAGSERDAPLVGEMGARSVSAGASLSTTLRVVPLSLRERIDAAVKKDSRPV